jgi:hypothetical protein
MLSQISLEDLVILLTLICGACVLLSAAMLGYSIHLLLRMKKELEIERRPFVARDTNGVPFRIRKK